jgi:hypothetical protein
VSWPVQTPAVWTPQPTQLWVPAQAQIVAAPRSNVELMSASQLGKFAECERKWGWEYLDKIKPPQNRSAVAGERMHKILEGWLQFATPPDLNECLVVDGHEYFPGRMANAGLHHLPPPGAHLQVERAATSWLAYVPGVRWNGRIDVFHQLLGDPECIDHKSTSDFKWAKTEEELRTDVQSLSYAWEAMNTTGAQNAHLRWVYYLSKKPFKSKVVYIRISREETLAALYPWEMKAARAVELKRSGTKRALDLEPNAEACDRYGGCPHRLRCSLSPEQILRARFTMSELSLEQRIDAANAAAGGQTPPPAYAGGYAGAVPAGPQYAQQPPAPQYAPAPAPAPQYVAPPAPVPAPWMPNPTTPGWESRVSGTAPDGQPIWEHRPFVAPAPAPAPQLQVTGAPAPQPAQAPLPTGLNPPESQAQALQSTLPTPTQEDAGPDTSKVGDQFDGLSQDALKEFALREGLVVPPRLREKNLRIAVRNAFRDKLAGVQAPAAVAPAPQQQAVAPAPQAPVPQQQAHAPQQPQAPAPQAQQAAFPQAAPPLTQAQLTALAPAPIAASRSSFVVDPEDSERQSFSLFINCTPQKTTRKTMSLHEAFGDCFEFAARNEKVPDYRMIANQQGAPLVCVQIRAKNDVSPLFDDVAVIISTATQEGRDVLATLSELASEVVVGSAA